MARVARRRHKEDRRERVDAARRAGWGRTSALGVLAGVLVAYAAFAVLVAVATATVGVFGIEVDLTEREWRRTGPAVGITAGVLLFVAYLFGGYVGGRMARRAGLLNGLAVFAGGLVMAGAAAAIVQATGESAEAVERLRESLRSFGVPTSGRQWGEVGTVAGVAALAGMLIGAVMGGGLGERWHAKLASVEPPGTAAGDTEADRVATLEAQVGTLQERLDDLTEPPQTAAPVLEDLTRDELYQLAQEAEIEGRSHMTKSELIEALHAEGRQSTPG